MSGHKDDAALRAKQLRKEVSDGMFDLSRTAPAAFDALLPMLSGYAVTCKLQALAWASLYQVVRLLAREMPGVTLEELRELMFDESADVKTIVYAQVDRTILEL